MSRNYKIRDQSKLYFVSYATVNWIDVLIRPVYKDIVVESLKYCIENKGLEIYTWCIMTSHVHLIIGSRQDKIEYILRDHKRHTSKEITKAISDNPQESRREWILWMLEGAGKKNSNNETYQFWQQNNNPIELSTNKMMDQKLDYIHQNPVKEGFCWEPQEYKYSSAIDYAGGKGLLPILFIE
ncbi:MAG: transposase [Imperialibacter sp.]|uniref:REP-associated tyrosine transposase n=1 Tax=Imperialibacter sp. TaxID=2038411 RepID=UPI0032ED5714